MGYRIFYSIFYLISLLPMRIHYMFSDLLYPLVYYIIRYRRKVVRKNLTRSFPEKDRREILHIERRFYRFFCDYFVENVKALTIKKEHLMKRMICEFDEGVQKVFRDGQMQFIYLGHFCNWELIASLQWWVPEDVHCAQLYSRLHNDAMDRIFYKIRSRYGGENINKKDALRRIVTLKRSGRKMLIGFISDQSPKRENIHLWVDFLNQDTPVFTGTERIAKKVDAAICYAHVRRVKRGYYHLTLKLMTENANEYAEHELTRLYMKMLEEDIRHDPARWLWTHNRWKRQRTGEPQTSENNQK